MSFVHSVSFQYYWGIVYVGDNFLSSAGLSIYFNDSTILKDKLHK